MRIVVGAAIETVGPCRDDAAPTSPVTAGLTGRERERSTSAAAPRTGVR